MNLDPVGAAPEARTVPFIALLFGAAAAPLFWTGQMVLGYSVTAHACYPGDHPLTLARTGALFSAVIVFDVVALIACAAGAAVSWHYWHLIRHDGSQHRPLTTREGRSHFLAVWGLLSSLWFFAAILFGTIASLWVPPCAF